MIDEEFKETFLAELKENIISLNDIIIKLEEEPANLDLAEKIMRIAHTIKGMAATMNYNPLSKLCHEVEELLEKISKAGLIDSAVLNFLFKFVDKLEEFSRLLETGQNIKGVSVEELINQMTTVDDLIIALGQKFQAVVKFATDCKLRGPRSLIILNNLEKVANIIKTDPPKGEIELGNIFGDLTVELVTSEDDSVIYKTIKSVQDVDSVELSLLTEGISPEQALEKSVLGALTVRISLRDLDQLLNLVGELVIANGQLEEMLQETGMNVLDTLSKVKDNVLIMQNIIMKMRMVSIDHVFGRFPRMISEIAAAQDKNIEFITRGGYTQVDRTLIEHLHEPLVHLIRNAANHGIEDKTTRQKLGKSRRGTIILTAAQEHNDIIISVADNGRGIDLNAVKTAAVTSKLVPETAAVSREQLLNLIFFSRFSTTKDVSEISGRGLGLAIAQEKVTQAGGTISVNTEPGKGTTFTMRFPLITPISRALLAKVNGMVLALPLTNISQILTVSTDHILKKNGQAAIIVRKQQIPILDLRQKLLPVSASPEIQGGTAIIWEKGTICRALLIDEVQGIEDVVIQKPDAVLSNIPGISGSTIIAGGNIALILDPMAFIEKPGARTKPEPKIKPKAKSKTKPKTKPKLKAKLKERLKSKLKGDPKEKSKGELKGEPKEESKEESKGEPKGEPKEESKEESKGEPKGEPKEEPKGESKGEPEGEPKEEPKGELYEKFNGAPEKK